MSVQQHLLAGYTRSMLAVILGQFTRKRFVGGKSGVAKLAEGSLPVQVLHTLISPVMTPFPPAILNHSDGACIACWCSMCSVHIDCMSCVASPG